MSKNFLVIIAVAALALLVASYPCRLFFAVTDDEGRDVISREVRPGDIVSVKFTHSVEKVEVVDNFVVTGDGSLLLRNSTFGSTGAGLPSGIEENVTTKDGLFVVENINRSFDRINMITGSVPRHRLIIAGIEYSLIDLVGDEKPFIISLKRKSLLNAFFSSI